MAENNPLWYFYKNTGRIDIWKQALAELSVSRGRNVLSFLGLLKN